MKYTRKLIILTMSLSFLITPEPIKATEYCVDNGGCGYNDCCRTSSLAPAIALGTIALVAIVAVLVQNTSGSAHCHSHRHKHHHGHH